MSESGYDSVPHKPPNGNAPPRTADVCCREEFQHHSTRLREIFYSTVDRQEEKIATLTAERNQLLQENKSLEGENATLAKDLEETRDALLAERETTDMLKRRLSEVQADNSTLERASSRKLKKVDLALTTALEEAGAQFDPRATSLEKVQYMRKVLSICQKEIHGRNADIEKLEEELKEANSTKAQNQRLLASMNAMTAAIKQRDDEIKQLRNTVQQAETQLMDMKSSSEEMKTLIDKVENYRVAYTRACDERDALRKKCDEDQQKWSEEAIVLMNERDDLEERLARGKPPKRDKELDEMRRNLQCKREDYDRLQLQFGRYRSEKEKELLSKQEQIDTLQQMLNSIHSQRGSPGSPQEREHVEEMKAFSDCLGEREAELFQMKNHLKAKEDEHKEEISSLQRAVAEGRSALQRVQEEFTENLKRLNDELSAKEAAMIQMNDELDYYRLMHATQSQTNHQSSESSLQEPSSEHLGGHEPQHQLPHPQTRQHGYSCHEY